jgi:hypothetical protein
MSGNKICKNFSDTESREFKFSNISLNIVAVIRRIFFWLRQLKFAQKIKFDVPKIMFGGYPSVERDRSELATEHKW